MREGSTVARTPEEDAIFIADEDATCLHALALPLAKTPTVVTTPLPGRPASLVVSGRRVLVVVRQIDGDASAQGALVVFQRKGDGVDLAEVGRVMLPPDAWGVALSPDGSLALVTSAWANRVSAIDLQKRAVLWSVETAREPRGVTILPNGDTAYVSHLIGAGVTRVDGLRSEKPTVKRLDLPAAPLRSPTKEKLSASLGYVAVASDSGDRVYFPRHALGALGRDAWFGVPTVDTLLTAKDAPLAPARRDGMPAMFEKDVSERMKMNRSWLAGTWRVVESQVNTMAQPRAAALRPTAGTMLVASEAADRLVELDTAFSDPSVAVVRTYPTRGAPSGVALSKDQLTAYVFCRSTFDLSVVSLAPPIVDALVAPTRTVHLMDDPLGEDLNKGRRLYYGQDVHVAPDVGCAACHPDGRDDGHTWHEATLISAPKSDRDARHHSFLSGYEEGRLFMNIYDLAVPDRTSKDRRAVVAMPPGIGFPRQTPMLVGRVSAAGPYGWHAEASTVGARVEAGFGLHQWRDGGRAPDANYASKEAMAVASFLRKGLVPPPAPKRALTPEETKGKQIYEGSTSDCARCHGPDGEPKDRSATALTALPTMNGFEAEEDIKFKPPNLQFVAGSPPYMHDGRYDTLESLIADNHDRMGKTAHLSEAERAALIAYLRTL